MGGAPAPVGGCCESSGWLAGSGEVRGPANHPLVFHGTPTDPQCPGSGRAPTRQFAIRSLDDSRCVDQAASRESALTPAGPHRRYLPWARAPASPGLLANPRQERSCNCPHIPPGLGRPCSRRSSPRPWSCCSPGTWRSPAGPPERPAPCSRRVGRPPPRPPRTPAPPRRAAVDGNTGTRWSSAFSDPQWIQVDLGATATIDQVVLNWEPAYARVLPDPGLRQRHHLDQHLLHHHRDRRHADSGGHR